MADLEKLNYSKSWMNPDDFPSLSFSKDWTSQDDFPTIETDETQVRKDMQCLHDEVKDYINGPFRDYVVATGNAEAARESAETDRVENESARVDAETVREQAEAQRVQNEQARQSAEIARNDWGSYSATKLYAKGSKAESGGSSYVCINPCRGIAPPNTAYWQLIAAHGRDGTDGAPGKDGQGAPSDDAPKAPGTASPGTSATFSRSDHVHPKQSVSKSDVGLGNVDNVKQQARITASGLLKGSGSGNVGAAVAGTDYIATGNITKQTLVAVETTPAANYEINWYYK